MTSPDLAVCQIPRPLWTRDIDTLDTATVIPHQHRSKFFEWMTVPVPLVTIVGPPGSGKTTLAGAIARYWVQEGTRVLERPDQRSHLLWDEFRLYWADAPTIMPAYRHSLTFQDEANYDNILQHTNLLFLDNVDGADEKYRPELSALVRARTDAGRVTVMMAQDINWFTKLTPSLYAKVTQGRIVKLTPR